MRWVAAVRWLLLQWLKRGRGQCEAHGRRRDKTALAFQPEAPAPLAPVDVSAEPKAVLQRVAERWPGQNSKFWGRPQDIDAGSQLCEQRVLCAHCCV